MADRTVSVALQLKMAAFSNGLRKAKQEAKDFGEGLAGQAKKTQVDWDGVGRGFLAVGAAAGVGLGAAVKGFADFDQAMSNVKAATHETAGNMAELRQAALDAGRDTAFSATEAAAGIENLAKAGVSTSDILGGGLKGALDLAAAGELDVADAAETAATAMTQFKLEGTQVPHIADLLAAAAGKAQGEVSDMAQALNQGGLVAAQMGLSIEETTGTLAAFASAGLIGSDAGTSFKTMLLQLANPSGEASDLMKELGINAYDASGAFVGMAPLAEQLKSKLSTLTQEQRDSALATIFGSDAIRAASVLYAQGGEGVADWTKKVDDAGYAAETAAIKQDNLRGDLEKLTGSFETALIGLGESGNAPLRDITQKLTGAVDAFDSMSSNGKTAITIAGGVTAAVGLAGGAALIAVPKIAAFNAALEGMGPAGLKAKGAAGALTKVGATAVGIGLVTVGILELTDALNKAQGSAFKGSLSQLATDLETFGETAVVGGRLAERFGESLDGIAKKGPDIKGLGETLRQALLSDAPFDRLDGNVQTVKSLDEALAQLVESGSTENAKAAFEAISREAATFGLSMDELNQLFPGYVSALDTATKATEAEAAATEKAGGASKKAVDPAVQMSAAEAAKAEAMKAAEQAAADQAAELDALIETMHAASGEAISLTESQIGYHEALSKATEAAKENGKAVDKRTGLIRLDTEEGRANQSALIDLAEATNDQTDAMLKNGASNAEVRKTSELARAKFVEVAKQMGLSKVEADKLSKAYIDIPDKVTTVVTNNAAAKPSADVASYRSLIETAPVKKNTSFGTTGIPKAWKDIQNFSQNVDTTLAGIDDQAVKVSLSYVSGLGKNPGNNKFAAGGPVTGGTPGRDSVHGLLMPGEHVLTTKDVDAMGGQGAVYDFRRSLHRYADGGAVSLGLHADAPSLKSINAANLTVAKAMGAEIAKKRMDFGIFPGAPGARGNFRGHTLNARTIAMVLAAERLLGARFHITQGSYSTRVAASGSTHSGGGAMDTNGPGGWSAAVRALRAVGFAAWHRTPSQGPWGDHIHSIAIGDPSASAAAKRQVADYKRGGDGLGGSRNTPKFGAGGRVNGYRNGGVLMPGELGYNETSDPEVVLNKPQLAELSPTIDYEKLAQAVSAPDVRVFIGDEEITSRIQVVVDAGISKSNRGLKRDVRQGVTR